jgi:hypothetical protein
MELYTRDSSSENPHRGSTVVGPRILSSLISAGSVHSIALVFVFFVISCLTVRAENEAGGIAVWEGTVYLTDTEQNVVLVKEPGTSGFQLFLSSSEIVAPRGLAVDETALYIADPEAHQVFRVDKVSRKIEKLLPARSELAPIDVAIMPTFAESNDKLIRLPALMVLDRNIKTVFTVTPSLASPSFEFEAVGKLGKRRFKDPRSISTADGRVVVSDYGVGTIFTSADSEDWVDVRSPTTVSFWIFTLYSGSRSGFFFPQLAHPEAAISARDFYYVIDGHKLYAYLPSKGRLVPLSFRNSPPSLPDRVTISNGQEGLYLAGARVEDFRVWPKLVPMTVEVPATGDVSTPLAALYTYLWKKGYLPTVKLTLPYQGISRVQCDKPACIVEGGRDLLPKTNVLMEQLLCEMNADLCSRGKMHRFKPGDSIIIPDVPFEPFLSPERHTFDGKTSARSYLEESIPDKKLLSSVGEDYLRVLNKSQDIHLETIPPKGAYLFVPVQRQRYYLSAERSELLSSTSGLAQLVGTYKSLSVRPYGATSQSSLHLASPQDVVLHDAEDLKPLEESMLEHIGYNASHISQYGQAKDVPILIHEDGLVCRHPAFFAKDGNAHAFGEHYCAQSAPVTSTRYVDWSDSSEHHGTCVSSIIGARLAPYGTGLAPGSELIWSHVEASAADADFYTRFYKSERQSFVVNVSSGAPPITLNTWTQLFRNPLVREDALFVAAADNDDDLLSNRQKLPASLAYEFPNVLSVGALDKSGKDVWRNTTLHQGSNTGRLVEVLAPGEAVPCAVDVSNGQALYSDAPGTSFAAPIVSAVAALLLEKRLSPAEVKARILATTDPIDKERKGEPLALFGSLNIDNALSNPKLSHFQFRREKTSVHLDADILEVPRLIYQDLDARVPVDTPIASDDILAIHDVGEIDSGKRQYRLVWFEQRSGRIQVSHVLLNGCLEAKDRETDDLYIFKFGGGCIESAEFQDQTKVITEMQILIAPTIGAARFEVKNTQ